VSVLLESLIQDKAGDDEISLGVMVASFLIVGAGAAAAFAGFSSLVIGLNTGLPDWVASAMAYTIFMSVAYLLHRRISFRSDAPHREAFPRYALTQASGLALASGFSFIAYSMMGMNAAFGALIVFAMTSMLNFVVLRLWAFR
jgi:putative flippase GtrA